MSGCASWACTGEIENERSAARPAKRVDVLEGIVNDGRRIPVGEENTAERLQDVGDGDENQTRTFQTSAHISLYLRGSNRLSP